MLGFTFTVELVRFIDQDYLWMVPITVSSSASPSSSIYTTVLKEKTTTFTVQNVPEGQWLKVGIVKHHLVLSCLESINRSMACSQDVPGSAP